MRTNQNLKSVILKLSYDQRLLRQQRQLTRDKETEATSDQERAMARQEGGRARQSNDMQRRAARPALRGALLAYAFVRGRPYRKVEPSCAPGTKIEVLGASMLEALYPDFDELRSALEDSLQMSAIKAWLETPSATTISTPLPIELETKSAARDHAAE